MPSAVGPDQHVADPDRVRALALQRALVGRRRLRQCGCVVVDEEPVLEVLAGVGEVEAEQLGVARRGRRSATVGAIRTTSPPRVTTTLLERARRGRRVAACCATCTASSSQSCTLTTTVSVGAVADERPRRCRRSVAAADVVERRRSPRRTRSTSTSEVRRTPRRRRRRRARVTTVGRVGRGLGGHGDDGGLGRTTAQARRRDPVAGHAGAAEPRVVAADRLDGHLGRGVDLDDDLAVAGRPSSVVQAAQRGRAG